MSGTAMPEPTAARHQSQPRPEDVRGGAVQVLRRDAAGLSATAAFVPVCVAGGDGQAEARQDATEAAGRIEIVLPGGQRVRVTGPVDRQALADVVTVPKARPSDPPAVACVRAPKEQKDVLRGSKWLLCWGGMSAARNTASTWPRWCA
jgi:hypothetical protein